MSAPTAQAESNPRLGIAFILIAMISISINDMLIKQLSGDYPLHEMVFVRSAIGIVFSLILVQLEGGFAILRTDRPWLHLLRGALVVVANMMFFTALAVMPLANATALFFVAPLFITVLSIPLLGEPVGARRIGAVIVGFGGIVLMLRPWEEVQAFAPGRLTLLLPVLAALCYALMQIMTRRLGVRSKASALAVYIQGTFLMVSAGFWIVAGDGRFAAGLENESLLFLLRAWRWPAPEDRLLFFALGANSAIIGYAISQAYRVGAAATIAPFEYVALPMAILWGWLIWGDLPGPQVAAGIVLIVGAGLFVFFRERQRNRPVASRRPTRRW